MANPSVTYTFTNGTVADATQVNQNFTDLINGMTDGSKSLNVDAITAAGKTTLNGAVDLGNATGDTITVNGLFAGTGGDASGTQKGLVTTGAQTFAGVKTFSSAPVITDASGIVAATASVPGIVTTSSQAIAGVKIINNGICLGASGNNLGLAALGLKCKIVSGTAPASQGGVTNVSHGLTAGTIVAVNVWMEYSSGQKMPPNYTNVAGYEYFVVQTTLNIAVELSAANSTNMRSQLFYAMIWYVE